MLLGTSSGLAVIIIIFCPLLLDDDSEPILGQWFEETISPSKEKVAPPPPPPPPPLESSPRVKSPNKQTAGENGNILASRKDPELVCAAHVSAYMCLSKLVGPALLQA